MDERDVVERRGHGSTLVTVGVLSDLERFRVKRQGVLEAPLVGPDRGDLVDRLGGLDVVLAEVALPNLARSLEQGQCLFVLARHPVQRAEVGHDLRGPQLFGARLDFENVERVQVELLGGDEVTAVVVDDREVVEAVREGYVVGAEHLFANLDRAFVEGSRLVAPTLGLVGVGEFFEAFCDRDVVFARIVLADLERPFVELRRPDEVPLNHVDARERLDSICEGLVADLVLELVDLQPALEERLGLFESLLVDCEVRQYEEALREPGIVFSHRFGFVQRFEPDQLCVRGAPFSIGGDAVLERIRWRCIGRASHRHRDPDEKRGQPATPRTCCCESNHAPPRSKNPPANTPGRPVPEHLDPPRSTRSCSWLFGRPSPHP